MKEFLFKRLYEFTEQHSMGVVNDTRFTHCFWPRLNEPVEIFAPGSSGLIIMGSPTPRNVVFPDDTIFEEEILDARYPAELAVREASPGVAGLINLTDEKAAIWRAAYDAAVASLPKGATKSAVQDEGRFVMKIQDGEDWYIAEMTPEEAWDHASGVKPFEPIDTKPEAYVKVAKS